MPTEIRAFAVTVPAGIPVAAPQVFDISFPPRAVKDIAVVVPQGCNGRVGFALGAAGQNVIPYNNGAWITASGETVQWELDGQITSGAWQMQAYNTGRYPHTLFVRFRLEVIVAEIVVVAPEIVPNSELSSPSPDSLATFVGPDGAPFGGV